MPRTKQFDEDEVLKKAMELFWEKGFHATSMQDLVNHLGINRASIYDTYGDKNAFFSKAFEHYRNTSFESLKAMLFSEPDVKEGFKKLFRHVIEDAQTDTCQKGCFAVNTITELVPGDDVLLEKLKENSANTERLFKEYIQRGISNGSLVTKNKPESIACTLLTLFSGLRVMEKVVQNPRRLNEMVDVGLSILE